VTNDSKTTVINPWSWNRDVNMLFLDQPVQVGFSYDELVKGIIDETQMPFAVMPFTPDAELNSTTLAGTFASQNPASTANTTSTAALAAWQFMQIWLREYPSPVCPQVNLTAPY